MIHPSPFNQTVQNTTQCSIHNRIPAQDEVDVSNVSCNCQESVDNRTGLRRERRQFCLEERQNSVEQSGPSTLSNLDIINQSRRCSFEHGRSGSQVSHELPLLAGVTRLYSRDSTSTSSSGIKDKDNKESLDDDVEPPPSYNDLFEKELYPSK